MAAVLKVVTPRTVKSVCLCLASDSGSAALMAIAADAPQIPTAPPVSRPRCRSQSRSRDHITPKSSVIITAAQTTSIELQPSVATSLTLSLSPSNATPNFRQGPDAHTSPRVNRSDSLRKWHERPYNKPISLVGAPYRWSMTAATRTSVWLIITPGGTLPALAW